MLMDISSEMIQASVTPPQALTMMSACASYTMKGGMRRAPSPIGGMEAPGAAG